MKNTLLSPLNELQNRFEKALSAAFPDMSPGESQIEIASTTRLEFGNYQCNSPMKIGKLLKMSPRQVAEMLIQHFVDDETQPRVQKLEVAGPGFINIHLRASYLSEWVKAILIEPHLGLPFPEHPQKIIVEFSSPNVAKELHVGHLRSTIIGDALARTFEFLGHAVIRLNHVGDWGTQFGMLIAYMKEETPLVLTGEEKTDLTHLMQWYKASKLKFDSDSAFKKRAQQEVVALQGGEERSRRAWELICDISRRAYQEIYDLLDVKITERGESFYNPQLKGVVDDLEKKGLITLSDGAKCIFLEGFQNREGEPLPLMVQKSDGGFNYDTTDMAAIQHRIQDERADRIIYVTDAGQSLHFQMVFAAAKKADYFKGRVVEVNHVPFGLVLGNDGKKFRTRSGETERLIDLLEEAVQLAEKIIAEKNPEMSEGERKELAKILGIGAVKYADLSSNRMSDYVFSYDRMLKFEGNTAVFLLYSYVRVAGIKRKVGVDVEKIKMSTPIDLKHPSEVALALHLAQFGEMLQTVAKDLLPNRLTDYLYGLATHFNAFFRDCRVEGSPEQSSRLLLSEATSLTMREGLHILGVKTVEKM